MHACYNSLLFRKMRGNMAKKENVPVQKKSDSIRDYVRQAYFEPARRAGKTHIRVVAGDVHTALGLRNRVPLVCNALRSRDLLTDSRVRIVEDEGPPSGQSTTVAITYEVLPQEREDLDKSNSWYERFLRLRGVARETFTALGGGEAFIKKERDNFFGTEEE
jgi:hypothetical protein